MKAITVILLASALYMCGCKEMSVPPDLYPYQIIDTTKIEVLKWQNDTTMVAYAQHIIIDSTFGHTTPSGGQKETFRTTTQNFWSFTVFLPGQFNLQFYPADASVDFSEVPKSTNFIAPPNTNYSLPHGFQYDAMPYKSLAGKNVTIEVRCGTILKKPLQTTAHGFF